MAKRCEIGSVTFRIAEQVDYIFGVKVEPKAKRNGQNLELGKPNGFHKVGFCNLDLLRSNKNDKNRLL